MAWSFSARLFFPRQGHYANDATAVAADPSADIRVDRIGDLLTLDRPAFAPN